MDMENMRKLLEELAEGIKEVKTSQYEMKISQAEMKSSQGEMKARFIDKIMSVQDKLTQDMKEGQNELPQEMKEELKWIPTAQDTLKEAVQRETRMDSFEEK